MEKRLITRTTLIVGGLFLLMAARNASPCSAQTESGLSDIPISVGEMAFNEGKNRGGDAQQLVTWKSEDLVLTTSGTFSGEFKVRYEGPSVAYPRVLDVLFVQIQGEYLGVPLGDRYFEPLTEIIPVVAYRSSARSAKFNVTGSFRIPDLDNAGSPLVKLWFNLTWVRVYRAGDGLAFHVLPGDANRYFPDIPQASFDQPPGLITGRLAYYQVLVGRGFKKTLYNYQKWIRTYLKNR